MSKYFTCFMMGIQKAVEYRLDFFISFFGAVFPIIIQVSMWSAIYHATGTGMLFGYTYQQMILYTFFVGVLGRFISTGFEYEMNDDIKQGGLNKYIVRPVNYYSYRAACFFGERSSVACVFTLVIIALLIFFYVFGFFQLNLFRIVIFCISTMLALALIFLLYFCIGLLGLWASEISRVFSAITIIISIISGGVFPLDILGENASKILFYLPFQYLLQFPVDIIIGKEMAHSVWLALGVQFGWVIFFGVLAHLVWNRGLKKYIAVGG